MQGLRGKVAIITGAGSGIGLATAIVFVAAGVFVMGVGKSAGPPALATEPLFRYHQCDITGTTAAEETVMACSRAFGGRIDILLNIAGVKDLWSGVDTLIDEDWDRVLATNLTAPVKFMRAVVPLMRTQGAGSIVNVSSKAGTSGAVAGVAYTASKHAVIGATKNVAWRFKDEGIRCNVICPGAFVTNIQNSVDSSKLDLEAGLKYKAIHEVHVAKSGVAQNDPAEVAHLFMFLCSDLSKHVNGAIIPIDNAWSVI